MATYESYKDSGVKWLGQIPSHWEVKRYKHVFTVRSKRGNPTLPQLCSTQKYGVIPQSLYENRVVTALKGLDLLKQVEIGDFVISLRSFQGGIEHAYYQGIISPAYTILCPNDSSNAGYFRYLLKCPSTLSLLSSMVTGIRQGQNIDYNKLKYEFLPIPPADEQEAIVSYLDKVTAEIDRAIEAQQKMIDALNERKQIIITRAVTRGLNPDAPLRDSGIDWLDQIPTHWDISQLKRFALLILSKMLDTKGGSITNWSQYICAKDVHFDGVDISDLKSMYFSEKERTMYRVLNGDVLIVEGGAGAGGCAIAKNIPDNIFIQNSINIIRPKSGLDNEYIAYLMQSFVKRGYIEFACNKATIPHFTKEKVGRVPISVPPIDEQKQIVSHLNSIISPIEDSISHCERMISLLQERKQIIINEVVTGKKKVI